MPQIPTKYFGNLEYRDEDVVQFPCGLQFLQSVREPGLCFLALPILVVDPEYHLAMTLEDLVALELETNRQPVIGSDIDCLAVLVVPESGSPSVNLLAPIVINRGNRTGLQAIRVDSDYSYAHSLAGPEAVCS